MIPFLYLSAYICLPDRLFGFTRVDRTLVDAFLCTLCGLLCGLIIGYVTEYYTNHANTPVREVSKACETGAATNIIYGLALGSWSAVLPMILLGLTAFICHYLLGNFGISLGAVGILSNLCITLATDTFGPVVDTGGLVEMCNLGNDAAVKTDALDAAGNTTTAVGKGLCIASAVLVSLSLYGAYITRSKNPREMPHHLIGSLDISINQPLVMSGLLIGAVIPYAFTAMCMKSVGSAANEMVREVRR